MKTWAQLLHSHTDTSSIHAHQLQLLDSSFQISHDSLHWSGLCRCGTHLDEDANHTWIRLRWIYVATGKWNDVIWTVTKPTSSWNLSLNTIKDFQRADHLCPQTCTILAFPRPDWNIFPQPITDGVPGQTEWSRSSTAPMGVSADPPSNPAVDNNPDRLAAALWVGIVAGDVNLPSYTPGGCCLFAFFSPPSFLGLGGTGWRWINLVG